MHTIVGCSFFQLPKIKRRGKEAILPFFCPHQ
jgi:hypothetical protein